MKLYLNFDEFAKTGGGTWVDYSEALLNEGFVRKSCFGALGKAEIQTVSMRLKPVVGLTALAVAILTATNDVRAKLTLDDDTPYFIGTIRPLVSGEVREIIKPISVEILDDTSFLESYIFTADSTLSSNLKVISSTPADSLVHWLISHATVKNSLGAYVPAFATTDIVIDAGVDTAVAADGLVVNTGDYVNAILDAVCYEYNLQYRCSEDGKLHFAPSVPATTVTGARTLADSDVKNYLNPKRGDDARRGAVVTYYPVVKGACVVGRHEALDSRYADDKTYGRGYEWLNTDEPGGQWPPLAYQNVTLSSYDLDKSKRKVLRYDFTTIRTKITFQDGSKSTAQSMGHAVNNGDGTARVYIQVPRNKVLVKRIDCICDCWYIDEEDERTTQVHQGQNPEKYEARYLHSGVTAGALLRAIVLRSTTGNLTHTFQALPALGLAPGEIVSLAPSALGFTGYVRIVSVTDYGGDKERPLVDIVAESVTPLDEIVVDTSEQVRSILQRGGVTILRLVTESTVVKYFASGSVEVRAEGDAVDILGGVVSWYLNDVLVDYGDSVSFYHADMEIGANVVRAVVTIPGIDFGDEPLDAEITISLVQDGATGEKGDTGESAKGVQLYFSSETLPTTSRGVPKIAVITCTALPQNLPVTEASDITWSCSDVGVTLTPKTGDMYSVEIDTSEVSTLSFSITATIGAYPVTRWINVVADGLPAPMKLPMATTETPKETLDGEPLVTGDYFVVGAEFVEASITYKVGTLWEYTGSSWVLSSDKMKALNAMGDFTSVASEAEDGVFCRLIAKEIYAQSAVIEEIGTKEITVKEDGSVGSEDFAEDEEGIPTSGYKLDNPLTPSGRRGRVRAHGGIFNNTTIYGSIIHDALVTRKSAPTTPVTFPSKTAWNRKDFWNALSVTENSADMIAADLNIAGTAYSYLRKITSASYIKTLLAYQSLAQSDWSAVTTYTSAGTGFADISGKVRFVLLGGVPLESRVQIYKNGALILEYISQTSGATRTFSDSVAVNKGDTIGWRYRNVQTTCEFGIDWRSPQNCIHVSNSTTSWDTIEGMASDYLVRGRWQCSNPITFDSNNIRNYALANAFIAGFGSLPEGVEIQADNSVSKVTYGGLTNQPVNSVINYGSSVRLNYTGGYITFVAGSNADGSFTGWYNATASISVLSKEGIVTSNIIPKDATREIGEFDNKFAGVWSGKLNGFRVQQGNDTHPQGSGGSIPVVATDGGLEVGSYIDFHATAGDYSARVDIFAGDNRFTFNKGLAAPFVNTGYGDNEVTKSSYEAVNLTASTSQTHTLSAFQPSEIRYVKMFYGSNYLKRFRLPSGGSYFVLTWGRRSGESWSSIGSTSLIYSGDTYLWNGDSSDGYEYFYIIRRIDA